MWFFKNKTIKELGLFNGLIDIHSHLLWGVDDGAKSAKMTAEMLKALSELGIKRMFCTPHIMANLLDNSSEYLISHFNEKMISVYAESGVEFRLAAEYMIDELFLSRFSNEKPLTYDGYHILVEMSSLAMSLNFYETIFEIISNGYIPVLAHPERYVSFLSYDEYLKLKKQGLKFQLNIISLSGIYGKRIKMLAEKLLLAGLYDFVGTDIHSPRMIKTIEDIKISSKMKFHIEELVNNNNVLWGNTEF